MGRRTPRDRSLLWRRAVPCLLAGVVLGGCKPKEATFQKVDPASLRQGPIRHELSPVQIARITKLQETFREVDSMPLAEWLEDFSRDENPDREIAVWESMAGPYTAYTARHQPSLAAKKEIFDILLQRSGSSTQDVLQQHKLTVLTEAEIKELLYMYTAPPQPIRASRE